MDCAGVGTIILWAVLALRHVGMLWRKHPVDVSPTATVKT